MPHPPLTAGQDFSPTLIFSHYQPDKEDYPISFHFETFESINAAARTNGKMFARESSRCQKWYRVEESIKGKFWNCKEECIDDTNYILGFNFTHEPQQQVKGKECRMTHAWWRAWSSPRRRLRFAVPFSLATSNASFSFSTWVNRCPPPVSILPTDAQASQPRLRILSAAFQPGNKTNFTEILAKIT